MRRLLFFCCAVVLVDTVFFSALTPILPALDEEFDLGKSGAGILNAAYPLGAALGAIPAGLLASRLGVRPIVLAGLVIVTVMTTAFGFAPSERLLDATRLVQGFGSAFAWTGALAWLIAGAPRERRGELIGIAMAAAVGGALLGPVLGGAASLVGRGPAFTAVAAVEIGLAAWALSIPSPGPGRQQDMRALLRSLRDRTLVSGAWFVILPGLLFGCLGVLSPLELDKLGWGAVSIGALFLVSAGIEALISPLIGRWSDRRGAAPALRLGLALSATTAAALPWPGSVWLLAAVVLGASVGFGIFFVPGTMLMTQGAEAAGLDHALALSLLNLAWAPGQVIGAAAGGALADATGDAVPYLLLAAICAASFALLGAASSRHAVSATRSPGR